MAAVNETGKITKTYLEVEFVKEWVAQWELLQKFLSLHYYYFTLEGVLGVQRRKQAQGTITCLFGLLFFSQNGKVFKNLRKLSKFNEKLVFFKDIFRVCSILAEKQRPKPIRLT